MILFSCCHCWKVKRVGSMDLRIPCFKSFWGQLKLPRAEPYNPPAILIILMLIYFILKILPKIYVSFQIVSTSFQETTVLSYGSKCWAILLWDKRRNKRSSPSLQLTGKKVGEPCGKYSANILPGWALWRRGKSHRYSQGQRELWVLGTDSSNE